MCGAKRLANGKCSRAIWSGCLQNKCRDLSAAPSSGNRKSRILAVIDFASRFQYLNSHQPYLISYFKYDPAKEIAKLLIPILIAQGTTDIQVNVQAAKVLNQAKPSARLLMINGMNHVLKEVPAEQEKQIKSYTNPSLPVAPKLIEGIISFIKSIKK